MDWFLPLLEENTIIKGFKITDKPYTNVHQNLFQDKVKFSSQEFPCNGNQFILEQTNCKSDKLYLCKLKTLNPNKFRLVLKTHKENQVVGIIPLEFFYKDSGKKLDEYSQIKIPVCEYEIGHIKFNKSKNIDFITLSDYHLNNLSSNGITYLKDKKTIISKKQLDLQVSKVRRQKNKMISVTLESYIRVKFRSYLKKNNSGGRVFSIIGPNHAKDFKKTKAGLKSYFGFLKIPFDFLKNEYNPDQKSIEFDENAFQPTNVYLSTHTSKKGGLYIKVVSYNYSNLLTYNDNSSQQFKQYYAELGYPPQKIEKKWQQHLEEERISIAEEKSWRANERYMDDYDPYGDTDLGNPNGWW